MFLYLTGVLGPLWVTWTGTNLQLAQLLWFEPRLLVFGKQQQKLQSVTVVVPATPEQSASVASPSGALTCVFRGSRGEGSDRSESRVLPVDGELPG